MSSDNVVEYIITKFNEGLINQENPDHYSFHKKPQILYELIGHIHNKPYVNNHHNYKMDKFYPLCKFITKIFIRTYNSKDLTKQNLILLNNVFKYFYTFYK